MLVSDFSEVVVPETPEIPGMVTDAECRYLYWLTSTQYTGKGAVVELGSWLGRSTVHLAAGLKSAPLHCFDRFQWRASHTRKSNLELEPEQDCQPIFAENLKGHNVIATKTEVADITWDGSPVEILFLDAPKETDNLIKTFEQFGGCLQPGSIIAFQDYLNLVAYPVALAAHQLRHKLEMIHIVQPGSTVTFRVKATIEPEEIADLGARTLTAEGARSAWREILDQLPPEPGEELRASLPLFLYDLGMRREAIEEVRHMTLGPISTSRWQEASQRKGLKRRYFPLFEVRDSLWRYAFHAATAGLRHSKRA